MSIADNKGRQQEVKAPITKSLNAFAPIMPRQPKVLILGSMPSIASLQQQCYYAHPRNAFWWIMGELLGAYPELDYETRVQKLQDAQVMVWDVIASCARRGSLDSAIQTESVVANDFAALFVEQPAIRAVFFNGTSVQALFKRHVMKCQQPLRLPPVGICLPSTSPANARLTKQQKWLQWRQIGDYLDELK